MVYSWLSSKVCVSPMPLIYSVRKRRSEVTPLIPYVANCTGVLMKNRRIEQEEDQEEQEQKGEREIMENRANTNNRKI